MLRQGPGGVVPSGRQLLHLGTGETVGQDHGDAGEGGGGLAQAVHRPPQGGEA